MSRERALKTLMRVRERRAQALDDAVKVALTALEEARASQCQAQDALATAAAAEAEARRRLATMTDCGETFDATALLGRQHLAETLAGKTASQQGEVERCGRDVQARQADLRTRRAEVARNRQKIDALREDIARLRAARLQADDDQQDEEAEEVAISRLIRDSRAAAQSRPA